MRVGVSAGVRVSTKVSGRTVCSVEARRSDVLTIQGILYLPKQMYIMALFLVYSTGALYSTMHVITVDEHLRHSLWSGVAVNALMLQLHNLQQKSGQQPCIILADTLQVLV